MLQHFAAKQITAVASVFGEHLGREARSLPDPIREQLADMMRRALLSTVETEGTELARIVGANLYPKVMQWLAVKQ